MAVSNTSPVLAIDRDTNKVNESLRKDSLKFRIATEYTASVNDSGGESLSTNNSEESYKYRITSQFGRKVLQRPYIVPNIIDDIRQKFSGVVDSIDYKKKEFVARIKDITDPSKPDELVTLSFEEIQDSDQKQLTKGDSFVWYIGYVQGRLVSREGFSKIRFRRLPAWSENEIGMASTAAKELFDFFHGNTDTTT